MLTCALRSVPKSPLLTLFSNRDEGALVTQKRYYQKQPITEKAIQDSIFREKVRAV